MRLSKKGQITFFIIVGIILLLSLVLYFSTQYLFKMPGKEKLTPAALNALKESLRLGIEKCIERETKNGAQFISSQSGYFALPASVLDVGETPFPYGLEGKAKTLLTKQEVENNLANYLNLAIPTCIGEGTFLGVDVKKSAPTSQVTISEDMIFVKVDYPIIIISENKEDTLGNIQAKVPLRLGYVYSTVNELVDKLQSDPDWIDMTYLSQSLLHIVIYPATAEGYLLTVEDVESKVPSGNLTFITAIKFP